MSVVTFCFHSDSTRPLCFVDTCELLQVINDDVVFVKRTRLMFGRVNQIFLFFGPQQDGSEPSFSCTHSDPPLSPISLISWEERDDVYPTIHVETSQFDSGQPTVETPLLKSDCGTMLVGQLEHVSYKPQIATLGSQVEEVKDMEEEQRDMSESGDEDRCSGVFRGLLGGLLSSVEVDFSDSPLGPTLSSVGGLSWPNTSPVLNRGVVLGSRSVENDAEEDSPCVRLQQEEITTPDMSEPCTSLCTVGTTLPYGYFPQLADVSSTKE